MQTFQKNMTAISNVLTKPMMADLNASNFKPVSERTVQFDVPKRADGTNRIKLTIEKDGTFMVRGFKVEDTDLMAGVAEGCVGTALKNIGTI